MPELHPLQERVGHVGAYLLDDGNGLTLIDALGKKDGRTILAKLAQLSRDVGDIRRIILTHGHVTHVKGAAALKLKTGAEVYAAVQERDVIEGRAPSGKTTWIPQRPWQVLPQQYLLNLNRVFWRFGIRVGLLTPPPVEIDHFLQDGERIGPVYVIHTPGHSPGSTSFYWPEMETLFAGDAVVTWPRYELGWKGLTEDFSQNIQSIRKLIDVCRLNKWTIRRIATGHGDIRETDDGVAELDELVAAAQ